MKFSSCQGYSGSVEYVSLTYWINSSFVISVYCSEDGVSQFKSFLGCYSSFIEQMNSRVSLLNCRVLRRFALYRGIVFFGKKVANQPKSGIRRHNTVVIGSKMVVKIGVSYYRRFWRNRAKKSTQAPRQTGICQSVADTSITIYLHRVLS